MEKNEESYKLPENIIYNQRTDKSIDTLMTFIIYSKQGPKI